jgi:triosephosphate isomerase
MNKPRKLIIAGNWKMNKTVAESLALVDDLKIELAGIREVDLVVCPPFTALKPVSDALTNTAIKLGAQHMHWENFGAWTGEICASMLRDLYCSYVIIGHSERRQFFGETDETVNKRVKAALAAHLHPIICLGETLEERESQKTNRVLERQARGGLAGLTNEEINDSILAYEPVWAIGTGRNATPEQAQHTHAFLRGLCGEMFGESGSRVRIQYGGSVKPGNARELMSQPDIDGALVGGASLQARSFIDIVKNSI